MLVRPQVPTYPPAAEPISWGKQVEGWVTLAVRGRVPCCMSYHLAERLTMLGEETGAEVKDLHKVTQFVSGKGLLYPHFQLTPGAVRRPPPLPPPRWLVF